MFKSLKCREENSVKMTPNFSIVYLFIISTIFVQFTCSESTIVSGGCLGLKFIGTFTCTNYTEIPTDIPNPETVRSLVLNEGNHIEILGNNSFRHSKWIVLQYLILQGCEVRVIEPGAFARVKQLYRIDLTGNMIDTLNPDIFSGLVKLGEIILTKNPIKRIATGKVFPNLPKLSTLYLDNCQLSSLPTTIFDNLNGLKILSLNGNNLKYLDWKMFRKTRSLQNLNLHNNSWYCDCKTKFLMETLKNRSIGTTGHLAICASADKWVGDWVGKSWDYVPKNEITCSPKIEKFFYVSYSASVQRKHTTNNVSLPVEIGDEIYFDCEYSGYRRPKITWFKDNQQIKETPLATNLTKTLPKIEFQDMTNTILQNMDVDERMNNYNWKGRLIVRRVQEHDRGTYECFVQRKHVYVHKTLYLRVAFRPVDTDIMTEWIWPLLVIFIGFVILVLIFAIYTAVWKRRSNKKQRGDIEDSSINLEDFSTEPTCRPTQQFQYTRFT